MNNINKWTKVFGNNKLLNILNLNNPINVKGTMNRDRTAILTHNKTTWKGF